MWPWKGHKVPTLPLVLFTYLNSCYNNQTTKCVDQVLLSSEWTCVQTGILPLDAELSGLCDVVLMDEHLLGRPGRGHRACRLTCLGYTLCNTLCGRWLFAVQKPEKVSYVEAAGGIQDGLRAYTALHTLGRVAAGHSVLVMDGASVRTHPVTVWALLLPILLFGKMVTIAYPPFPFSLCVVLFCSRLEWWPSRLLTTMGWKC